jgi:hypothetical protein
MTQVDAERLILSISMKKVDRSMHRKSGRTLNRLEILPDFWTRSSAGTQASIWAKKVKFFLLQFYLASFCK